LLNDGSMRVWDHLPPDPARLLSIMVGCQTVGQTLPLMITPGDGVTDGLDVLNALFAAKEFLRAALVDAHSIESDRSIDVLLSGGNDGARPTSGEFQGFENLLATAKTGLRAFEDIDEISIVAAPGTTFGYLGGYEEEASRIVGYLIAHAERMQYRIAVLDSGDGLGQSDVRAMRAKFDSKSAALYYPWVRIHDPITGQDINLPPSGFVSGVYARNDLEKGVSKSPANQVVNLASGLETLLNDVQQGVLNPEGINCLRAFEGRGVLVWGARTISSDPEWKYVSVRRYCAYVEHSIDRGTQWTVFEPNGEALWAAVRRNIEEFLLNEWRAGALTGDKPEMAFFVRCDRSTMTQRDLDNGRLVCLIGMAPMRPAEFVILRIGQWTADRKC
jgi:phage tail sheath protein FI